MPGAGPDQGGQVPQGVPGLVLGPVGPVGGPPARRLTRVGLDQLPTTGARRVQLDQLTVGAGVQVLAQELLGHRVQRLGDLDVVVAVDLDPGEDRLVIRVRHGQQHGGRELGEHLDRAGLDRAVDPHPGPPGAPGVRAGLRVGKVGEVLPSPEVATHVLNRPLHPWLVLG